MRLRPLQPSWRRVPVADIALARVATYAARDYGGWHRGMRTAPGGNTVHRLRGTEGSS